MEMMLSYIMLPTLQVSNSFFPFNPSLEDEMKRLFDNCAVNNAKDCQQNDPEITKHITPRRKKNKKPLPTECVFCRNNGEEETYYRQHLLKDVDGRILCPVLRAYTCPICGACGDVAHTVKYCPKGPYNPNSISTANAFKLLRNSVGKRRGKKE
ncbi:nanos homolog 2 isoform X2 [Harpegnathos saltator]|uniref:nanos homolog 2 isoform X2 n=1 Tax=Harpegnathos saltator TaxID=610380 RepID=UPI00058CDFED|nr:nanos homolog 2 isoform X2 [Harpegnathos saltator]